MNIEDAPNSPGVYIFKDKEKKPIYIGKAGSLKKRLSSYLKPTSLKGRILVSQIASLEWFLCDSELEALVLEANLIKKYKPKFNVCLKDDKAYPFIKITKEAYPRILITRKLTKPGYYFGPYKPGSLRKTIKIAKELFKIRSCKTLPKDKNPCLLFHIDQCIAPCKGEIEKGEYNKRVLELVSFLSGRHSLVLKTLKKRMKDEAKSLNFEAAGKIRDKILAIKSLYEAQKAFFTKPINCDVIALSNPIVFVLVIREGRLIGEYPFTISFYENAMTGFIKQFYLFTYNIPDEIIIEDDIEDKSLIEAFLSERKGKRVLIKVAKRGKKRELLLLAKKNASIFALRSSKINIILPEILGFFPKVIEAIDISNISGAHATASLVAFENGIPNKNKYRRFKIQTKGPDDYGMIREVLERRFKGLKNEDKGLPDLLLIDGGRGHLNVAINTLKSLGLNVKAASIAKEPDRLFLPDKEEPIELQPFSIFASIRDEAHRFALSYHKKLRRLPGSPK